MQKEPLNSAIFERQHSIRRERISIHNKKQAGRWTDALWMQIQRQIIRQTASATENHISLFFFFSSFYVLAQFFPHILKLMS